MGILDWWCHPFHHCPNSSFNSLEFHLRNNLPWILIGRCAKCSVPWLLLMLTWEPAKSLCPAVHVLVLLCPRDTALPRLPGLSGAAVVFWGSLYTDTRLVESPAFLPSAVTVPWMIPPGFLSTVPFLLPIEEKLIQLPLLSHFRAECG